MAGYQYTIIIGNVGREPEMRYTQSGVAVCDFSVAVSRRWTDRNSNERREQTTWFRVTAWRALAETVNQYVHKGMQIMVTGTVDASAYAGQDGQPRATLELTAQDVQFLGQRGDAMGMDQGAGGGYPDDAQDLPF
ncbi:MAG TPA: single-stranded DNA-binding protein [Aggregatilinea sp.]|jgi:single-strand DNA-binding protein|uniref:single-stranded DNA-binding protein n=1 Tax=Aggregatilinea sp. TaxID=2806333 RepID=UPI002B75C112|nr:single-stranded DNA-binding protein [Aggregatilinea sp.]HML21275.1 single-stranded DNA-binding protein [Aggregatilinea sp.]